MGNYGSGGRASYASLEKQMAAYDALPRSVRNELADGYENWAAYPIHQRWQKGNYKDAKELLAVIQRWNKEQREKDARILQRYLDRKSGVGIKRDGRGRFQKERQFRDQP